MKTFVKRLRQRWDDWVGDHEMEQQIRRGLIGEGYYGNTARITAVRLVAVQRPGWVQVFRFDVLARVKPAELDEDLPDPEAEYHSLFGLIRDDARGNRTQVRFFQDEEERRELFGHWSEGLICTRGGRQMEA